MRYTSRGCVRSCLGVRLVLLLPAALLFALVWIPSCESSRSASTSTKHVRRATAADVNDKFEQDDQEARIVGGHDSVEGRHLYMVSLWSNSRHECGGVLVAPDVILTAAHCIHNGEVDSAVLINKAILGRWDLNEIFSSTSTVISTAAQIKHDDYQVITSVHDVGLIKLVTPAPSNLPTVTLNTDTSLLLPDTDYSVLGWGDLYGNGTFPKKLQQAQVQYITPYSCKNAADPELRGASYASSITDDMMCATANGSDACYGDSGGPLVYEKGATRVDDVVVGIVSWGIDCARMPGVYSRVDVHFDWIQQEVCELSEDPPSYFGCPETSIGDDGGIRDDSPSPIMSTTSPPSMNPTPSPTMPTTSAPTKQPTPAYSATIVLPPIMLPPSPPTNAPLPTLTTTSPPVQIVWQWQTRGSLPSSRSRQETSSAPSSTWTLLLPWITLSSTVMVLMGLFF